MATQPELKEIRELMTGLKVIAVFITRVLNDGKIGIDDTIHLMQLMSNQGSLIAAIQGISEVPAEVKSIELEQAGQLVIELIKAIAEVKAEAA